MTAPDQPFIRRPEEIAARPHWARALYLARIDRGLTLQQVADRTGIHITALSRYETGGWRPSAVTEARIREALR